MSMTAFALIENMIMADGKFLENMSALSRKGTLGFIVVFDSKEKGFVLLLGNKGIDESDT